MDKLNINSALESKISEALRGSTKKTAAMPAATALYIGRFQLFHLGHLDVVRQIMSADDVSELVLGIGSAQYNAKNPSPEAPLVINPFTWEERRDFIGASLKGNVLKPYTIIPINDLHNCQKWAAYVINTAPDFRYFYSNTKKERELFQKAGYECRPVQVRFVFHAGAIREWMAGIPVKYSLEPEILEATLKKHKSWEELVPQPVAEFVKRADARERIRELYKTANGGRELDPD